MQAITQPKDGSVKPVLRMGFSILGALVALAVFAYWIRCQQVVGDQVWLDQMHAEYYWYHQPYRDQSPSGHAVRTLLARSVGASYISSIESANLSGDNLDDTKLARVDGLRQLSALSISSDLATDATVSRICHLPNLTRLRLSGERFTFLGLLELRKLTTLQSLELQGMELSIAELSVLESALPQVKLSYDGGADRHSRFASAQWTLLDDKAWVEERKAGGGLESVPRGESAWSLYEINDEAVL